MAIRSLCCSFIFYFSSYCIASDQFILRPKYHTDINIRGQFNESKNHSKLCSTRRPGLEPFIDYLPPNNRAELQQHVAKSKHACRDPKPTHCALTLSVTPSEPLHHSSHSHCGSPDVLLKTWVQTRSRGLIPEGGLFQRYSRS